MKVTTWVTFEKEIDVEIDISDFLASLDAERDESILRVLNRLGVCFRAITDDQIANINPQNRQIVCDFLMTQYERFGGKTLIEDLDAGPIPC